MVIIFFHDDVEYLSNADVCVESNKSMRLILVVFVTSPKDTKKYERTSNITMSRRPKHHRRTNHQSMTMAWATAAAPLLVSAVFLTATVAVEVSLSTSPWSVLFRTQLDVLDPIPLSVVGVSVRPLIRTALQDRLRSPEGYHMNKMELSAHPCDPHSELFHNCLLYTSPSPRD